VTTLATRLDGTATDLDRRGETAAERLARHSRWWVADSVGTHLSTSSRWARTGAADLRRRAAAIQAAERLLLTGPRLPGSAGAALIPDHLEDWIRGALGIWNGRADETFPLGRWVFGNLWINRVAQSLRGANPIINDRLHVPSIANSWLPRRLMTASHFRWLSNPAVQTVGKRLILGFAVVSTIGDARIAWDHGNPIDAFERDGAGYVADVARLGFSASTTAFFLAPNPVTGGFVIVTGVVWAGAEAVDHWDEITETWNAGYAEFEREAQAFYHSTSDGLVAGWDWTSDRWDDLAGWTSDGLGLSGLGRAIDWGDDRLDDAGDWTGDRVDDLVDESAGLIDTGADAFDFTKSLFGR
jgi:hypothetical protein